MPNTFPCLACGAPIEPEPNKERMPCPFCGTALTIPVHLRWEQAIVPETPPTTEQAAFDPFRAAENARFTGEQAEKVRANAKFVTDALRKAQPLATGAVSAYALWASLRRFLPGCLITLISLCVITCTATGVIVYFLQKGG